MIVTENVVINEREFVRTVSDSGRYVVREGVSYEEAYDPAEFGRIYTEGELIPEDTVTNDSDKVEAYDILMGVQE